MLVSWPVFHGSGFAKGILEDQGRSTSSDEIFKNGMWWPMTKKKKVGNLQCHISKLKKNARWF